MVKRPRLAYFREKVTLFAPGSLTSQSGVTTTENRDILNAKAFVQPYKPDPVRDGGTEASTSNPKIKVQIRLSTRSAPLVTSKLQLLLRGVAHEIVSILPQRYDDVVELLCSRIGGGAATIFGPFLTLDPNRADLFIDSDGFIMEYR